MKTLLHILLPSLCALALVGCSSVSSVHPVGVEEVTEESREEWNGQWLGPDGVVQVHSTDEGEIVIGVLEWQGDAFEVENVRGLLRQFEDYQIVNLRVDEEEEDSGWLFGLAKLDENQLFVWIPDPGVYGDLGEAGKIKGDKDQGSFELTGSPEELLAMLEEIALTDLFDFTNPISLLKLERE